MIERDKSTSLSSDQYFISKHNMIKLNDSNHLFQAIPVTTGDQSGLRPA